VARKLLCLGYGYTARALAQRLAHKGWRIAGTARAQATTPDGVEPVRWSADGFEPSAFDAVDAILISTPPSADGCPAFVAAANAIAARGETISWIGYLSSNAVYGDYGGAWVDEDSDLHPITERGRARVVAEAQWAAHGVEWAQPVVIFRLPGIYGLGRSAIDAVREGKAQRIVKAGQVFNRMHVEDIAAALASSIDNPFAGELFCLADDLPAPPQAVVEYACDLLGVAPPPLTPFEEAKLSEIARSFYAENKRVRNDRMKEAFDMRLQYPTYKEGLRAILEAERKD
jgi:nucleoside-diphosphate-sugar epimerase